MQRAAAPVLRAVHRPYLPLSSSSFTIPSLPLLLFFFFHSNPPIPTQCQRSPSFRPPHVHPRAHSCPPNILSHQPKQTQPDPRKKSKNSKKKEHLPSSELLKALLMVRVMRVTSRHPQPADGDAGGEASSSAPLHARCRSKAGRGSSGDEARRRPGEAGSDCERHFWWSGAETVAAKSKVVGGDGGWVGERVAMAERS